MGMGGLCILPHPGGFGMRIRHLPSPHPHLKFPFEKSQGKVSPHPRGHPWVPPGWGLGWGSCDSLDGGG